MEFQFGPRRATFIDITDEMGKGEALSAKELKNFEDFDLIYRSLCAVMYNYVPTSGHPGGSISSGRFTAGLVFNTMDYDFSNPERPEADVLSYAAGHKALGLYAMWALRNEVIRAGKPDMLPKDIKFQLRLEDLLGFRRNPVTDTPLFKKFHSKPLDGHPTPATPFVKLATGASGVGVATSLGLAFGARDYYGTNAPVIHISEGEGGMTPGRVAEAFASAGTSCLENALIHIDWNQASIDSNAVCRDGDRPGDYVQWDPCEFAHLHDWNVVFVPDGKDFKQVIAAQRQALEIKNGQPTAIVYRTIKGWQYGIEGRASHGAGHKMCTEGFYKALDPFLTKYGGTLPACDAMANSRCEGGKLAEVVEECFWQALLVIRNAVEKSPEMVEELSGRIAASRDRLDKLARAPRDGAPDMEKIYEIASKQQKTPDELKPEVGKATTLRGVLGNAFNYYNRESNGAIFAAAADLLGSTSVSATSKGFPEGFFNAKSNPGARLLSVGGICEDAISGVLAGISTFDHHIGIGSSYGAFIAPLGHIASRLHCIGNQDRQALEKGPYRTFVLICAHAGLKTGEDGPTHADPQCLQLLEENFPRGTFISLTPWDPQEIWPLLATALSKRPAVIAPFVTRPNEKIYDRKEKELEAVDETTKGMYLLKKAKGDGDGTVVLQGSGVTYAFVEGALPLLQKEGVDLNVYYVSSAEIFDSLPISEQRKIFPDEHAGEAMGITGFTLPTMYKWIRSEFGREMTLYPYKGGHYLGSGQAGQVLKEAGLDGQGQFKGIMKYVKER